jgi:hypothetical protein
MIILIGYGGCGFTFLDWTLAFLSNRDCVPNPVTTNNNAHLHAVDHFDTAWQERTAERTYWVPPGQAELSQAIKHLGTRRVIVLTRPNYQERLFLLSRLEQQMPHLNWYSMYSKSLAHVQDQSAVEAVFQQVIHRFVDYLDFDQVPAHYRISVEQIFLHLDKHIERLMHHVGLNLDQNKLDAWLGVYQQWQQGNPWVISPTVLRIVETSSEKVDSVNVRNAARFLHAMRNH